jgi:hypothetical protein
MLTYLRIAMTALSLTACMLLLALWVWSYGWVLDVTLVESNDRPLVATFHSGRVVLGGGVVVLGPGIRPGAVQHSIAIEANAVLGYFRPIGYVPCWLAATTLGLFASAPWFRFRFSLRTLLIATTLVAAGLGVIVIAS